MKPFFCQKTFLSMKLIKNKAKSRLTDSCLTDSNLLPGASSKNFASKH